jgi:hypothetical protein
MKALKVSAATSSGGPHSISNGAEKNGKNQKDNLPSQQDKGPNIPTPLGYDAIGPESWRSKLGRNQVSLGFTTQGKPLSD